MESGKMKYYMLLIASMFLILFCGNIICSANEYEEYVEILIENNIVKGDADGLRLDENITWGEYVTMLNRVYSQEICEMADFMAQEGVFKGGLENWKEASIYACCMYMSIDEQELVRENFDKMANVMDITKLTATLFNQNHSNREADYSLLESHGVDVTLFSEESEEPVTRKKACELINKIFYIDVIFSGGYSMTQSVYCYTPQGLFLRMGLDITSRGNIDYPWDIIEVLIDSRKDIDKSAFFGINRNTQEFFKTNIKVGQDMDTVFGLIGRAYLYEENDVEVQFTYFIDDANKKALLTFEDNILTHISFEDTDEKVIELKLYQKRK